MKNNNQFWNYSKEKYCRDEEKKQTTVIFYILTAEGLAE